MGSHHSGSTSSKKRAMARPSGIMQIGVPITRNRNAKKGTLAHNHRISQPRHPTLQVGCQLLRLVCNDRTKSASAPQRRMAACPKCTLVQLVDWFKQETVHDVQGGNSCWPKIIVIADYTVAQRATAANERNIRSAILLIEILVKVSSRKWGRSNGMGEGLSAHSVRMHQSGLSAWCSSCLRPRVPVYELWQGDLIDIPWPIA